ncbi:hypothetical protein ACKKBG_A16820 [Auxenochlorella protothecoides x Auxenochlorella symbiontica]
MRFTSLSTLCLCLLVAASCAGSGRALSWPLCDPAGLVWMTERPERDDVYPGSNLWFFCNSGINILGDAVSICSGNGTRCDTLATATVLCQILGYDEASSYQSDVTTTTTLAEGQAVRSLSGEFCQADGSFTLQRPEGNAAPLSNGPCTVLNKLVCVRLSSSMDAAAESAFLAISENQFGGKEIAPAAELIAEVADSLPGGRKLLGK